MTLDDFYNLIILTLILAILFSTARLFLYTDMIISANSQLSEDNQLKLVKVLPDDQNRFFYRVIHHVFPSKSAQEAAGEGFQLKGLSNLILKKILNIDFKNPLTFVQAEFTASQVYNDSIMKNNEIENGFGDSDNSIIGQSNNIGFEDVENSVTTGAEANIGNSSNNNPQNADDLSELREGVYIIGEDDIVDSLENEVHLSLDDVEIPKKIKFEKGKPGILIYHTHGTESYKPATEGNYHSLKKEYTVIAVGEIIAKELEKEGFQVIHDTTYHDYPSYNGSYTRSLETVEEILKENPFIKVIFDIHRDGYDNVDSHSSRQAIALNNKTTLGNQTSSKFQLVIGSATPNRKKVETFAKYIKAVSDSKYPDFSKPVLVKPYGQFNQFLVDHYALIEVGSNVNTIEEAKNAAYYLADVLVEALRQICQD